MHTAATSLTKLTLVSHLVTRLLTSLFSFTPSCHQPPGPRQRRDELKKWPLDHLCLKSQIVLTASEQCDLAFIGPVGS